MLSEDKELEGLRERIADVARNERNGLLIIPMGVFLVGVGLILSVIGYRGLTYIGGIFISTLGLFSTFFGFFIALYYGHKYNNLLKELEHTLK